MKYNSININLKTVIAIYIIVAIIAIVVVLNTTPIKAKKYLIRDTQTYYVTNDYKEIDECVLFDNIKICGNYTIVKRGM